jgi:hypothetical protein
LAQTEHLPIYKATYDLCLYLEQIVQYFWGSRRVKSQGVLGREILKPKGLLDFQTERLSDGMYGNAPAV